MKLKHILPILTLGTLAFQSCDDNKMEWYDPHDGNGTSSSELPLLLAEQIKLYNPIKSYIPNENFVIGAGIGMDQYLSKENVAAYVNENFNSVTLGNAMKMSSIINSKGEADYSKVDAFLQVLPQDIAVYGHNLIWHTQQAATYLKSIIAAEYIPDETPDGNVLDVSTLKDGDFGSWNPQNKGAGITIESGQGAAGGNAIKMVASSSSSNAWDLQLITPDIPVIEGHSYQLSFMVRSEGAGKGRVSFQNLSNNYPWLDWLGTGGASEAFEYGTAWTQVTVNLPEPAADATTFKCCFDFGYVADAVTYIDVNTLKVIDLNAPVEVNLVTNGSFEDGADNWSLQNKGTGMEVVELSDAIDGKKVLKATSSSSSANAWDLQFISGDIPGSPGKTYELSFYVKADGQGKGRISFSNLENGYPWLDWLGTGSASEAFEFGASWTFVKVTLPAVKEGNATFKCSFDFGYLADATYYFDNIKVTEKAAETAKASLYRQAMTRGFIEKTDEEKAAILDAAMKSWITGMVGHYKERVHAWDVLNEPIDDGLKIRGAEVMPADADMDADDFYWGKYMGKDYAVKAFQYAREADPTAKLFINDYNLEYNLNKLDKLIEYVNYIDQTNGSPIVDGIGTQMHVDLNTNKDQIKQMFEKMAATGKLVRITELDIKVNTSSPTAENLIAQAEMYRYIIEQYRTCVPEAQQACITLWGISDHPDEHVYWIPNDAPNLLDANYARKPAYKGVCDGIAGRDISEDFSGDDWKDAYGTKGE